MELDVRQIQEVIPHRFPFLLIDKVIELTPNEKLIAVKNVSINEQYFVGHFPHEKIMPGVLIVEAMAQAGSVFFYYSKNFQGKNLTYYLAKVEAKFIAPVIPGDRLIIEVTPLKLMTKAGLLKVKASVAEKVVAEAEIGFGVREN